MSRTRLPGGKIMRPKNVMKLQKITPKQANQWLEKSAQWAEEHPEQKNRRVSNTRVRRLEVAIRAGEWEATNQGILIGRGGIIIDGQHRLAAIARSGVTCEAYVLERLDITSPLNVPVDIDGAARKKWWVLGLTRADYEVANMILEYAAAGPERRTITYKQAFSQATIVAASEYVELIGLTKHKRRAYSQVPVRAGAALASLAQSDAVPQYAALVGQAHGTMWPIVGHLGSMLSSAMLEGRRIERRDVLVKAYKAFSAKGAERDRRPRTQLGKHDARHTHQAALHFVEEAGITL